MDSGVDPSDVQVNTDGAPPPKVEVPQYEGEMPDDDVDDDPDAQPPETSIPDPQNMDAIPGYNNVGFSGGFLPPPPAYNEVQPPEDRGDIKKLPVITEDEAREALMGYVSEHCCYGKGAAEDLTFTELESTDAFYYELDTFTEARSTEWAFTPYLGGPLDGPEFGPAPGPWDIPAQCTKLFKDEKRDLEVPHTASAKPCHQCFATGFIRCWKCHGRGRTRCMTCHGTGNRMDGERCVFCHGDGRRRCITCHAKGCVVCNTCQGHRMLKWFIKLTIKWHKHDDHVIVEKTDLPDELIKKANGEKIFKETYPRVYPLQNFPEQEINVGSADLVAKHQYSMERILMQKHKVKLVPVTVCKYNWKDQTSCYFVYGLEKKVYAPDYPQQMCCGCSIL